MQNKSNFRQVIYVFKEYQAITEGNILLRMLFYENFLQKRYIFYYK
jgi:hypothetical protein